MIWVAVIDQNVVVVFVDAVVDDAVVVVSVVVTVS